MKAKFKEISQELYESSHLNNLKYLMGSLSSIFGALGIGSVGVLRSDEFAIIEKYNSDIFLDVRNILLDFPVIYWEKTPIKTFGNEQREYQILTFKDLNFKMGDIGFFFHLPKPLENHYIFNTKGNVEIKIPLLFPISQYEFVTLDSNGEMRIYRHYPNGISDIKTGNLIESGLAEKHTELLYIKLRLEYNVKDVEKFSVLLTKNSFSDIFIENFYREQLGINYSSITGSPEINPGIIFYIFRNAYEQEAEKSEDPNEALLLAMKYIAERREDWIEKYLKDYMKNTSKPFGIEITKITSSLEKDFAYKAF